MSTEMNELHDKRSVTPPVILYVEDDMMSRKVMEILFVEVMKQPNITIFADSKNFMEQVQALPEKPNLIFLDIQMQPYDGYEVLKMLRNSPLYAKAIIIALTANVMAHDVEQLKSSGFDGLIGKPILHEIFPELVQRIIDGESIWYIP